METKTAEHFARDVAKHEMTVLHDDGLYRHLRFQKPGTRFYRFDLVTWPGKLSFVDDLCAYTFSRVPDMFMFFRGSVDPGYWAEKIIDSRERIKRYSQDMFAQHVKDRFVERVRCNDAPAGLGRAVREKILDDPDIGYKGFRFADTWEWDFYDWNWSYLWACYGIQWGISMYDAAHAAALRPRLTRTTGGEL